jgi:hypothetical protein
MCNSEEVRERLQNEFHFTFDEIQDSIDTPLRTCCTQEGLDWLRKTFGKLPELEQRSFCPDWSYDEPSWESECYIAHMNGWRLPPYRSD